MEITPASKTWASKKLSRFNDWPGFPKTKEGVEAYVRSFLRIVHGKTVAEILGPGVAQKCKLEPDMNDADWILDYVYDNMEYFPKPVELRDVYSNTLPVCSNSRNVE